VDGWLDTTTVGCEASEPTLGTKIGFLFLWVKYSAVPEIVRFVIYAALRAVADSVRNTRRSMVVAGSLARAGAGAAPLLLAGHAGRVAARSLGLRGKGGAADRGKCARALRGAMDGWRKESAFWAATWATLTGPARRFFRKRMVPQDGYEESWLRRYGDELPASEVEELRRRIDRRAALGDRTEVVEAELA